jgi:hypothetical protein
LLSFSMLAADAIAVIDYGILGNVDSGGFFA